MAGTLTISTLSDGTNSTSATNPILGSAKVWVNFNGSGSATIRSSYNVSSVTYNGTGDYTITFTSALANADYSSVASTGLASQQDQPLANKLTSSVKVRTSNSAGALTDDNNVSLSVFSS
jgi:hypothetical protein